MAVKIFKKGSTERISQNFVAKEFDCPCSKCSETPIDVDFVIKVLQPIRIKAGRPMYVNAYRCPAHNAEVPNASPNSRHMNPGDAYDCQIPGFSTIEIARLAEQLGAKGIGYYEKDDFCHLDNRPNKKFWLGHEQTPWDTFLDDSEKKLKSFIEELEALLAKYK